MYIKNIKKENNAQIIMEQQPQLNDHNKQEYPPDAYSRAFAQCHYGKNIRMSSFTKCTYRKEKKQM